MTGTSLLATFLYLRNVMFWVSIIKPVGEGMSKLEGEI
jgi:hypothetical protein